MQQTLTKEKLDNLKQKHLKDIIDDNSDDFKQSDTLKELKALWRAFHLEDINFDIYNKNTVCLQNARISFILQILMAREEDCDPVSCTTQKGNYYNGKYASCFSPKIAEECVLNFTKTKTETVIFKKYPLVDPHTQTPLVDDFLFFYLIENPNDKKIREIIIGKSKEKDNFNIDECIKKILLNVAIPARDWIKIFDGHSLAHRQPGSQDFEIFCDAIGEIVRKKIVKEKQNPQEEVKENQSSSFAEYLNQQQQMDGNSKSI